MIIKSTFSIICRAIFHDTLNRALGCSVAVCTDCLNHWAAQCHMSVHVHNQGNQGLLQDYVLFFYNWKICSPAVHKTTEHSSDSLQSKNDVCWYNTGNGYWSFNQTFAEYFGKALTKTLFYIKIDNHKGVEQEKEGIRREKKKAQFRCWLTL